jgi:hypothetical protein
MTEKLQYVVSRGKNKGIFLSPHRYEDSFFRAHKTHSRKDQSGKQVKTEEELIALVRLGFYVRMSNRDVGHPPSTVKPEIVKA